MMWEMYYQYLYLHYLHSVAQQHQDDDHNRQLHLQDHQDLQANQQQQPPDQVADGEDREEEDGGEDLLDWIYQSSRVAIFLSIVYYYSSLTRVLVVLGLAALIYLHQVSQNVKMKNFLFTKIFQVRSFRRWRPAGGERQRPEV